MKADVKVKWLEALRGGAYEQGQHDLRRGNSYCCLGVLCDVAGMGEWVREGECCYGYLYAGGSFYCLLPDGVKSKYNIPDEAMTLLIDMNDWDRKSFAEIADWIEENL